MENSKFETLKLPPHRRRPLRSQTFQTLLRILSIFDDSPQQSHPPASNPGSGGIESGAATRSDGDLAHANIMSYKYLFQNESLVGETQSVLGTQERDWCNTHEEIVGSNHTIRKGNKEMAHEDNTNLMKPLGNKNQDISLLTSDLEDQSCVQRLTEECTGKTEVDHKPPGEIRYANSSSLEGDKIGTLNPSASNNEKNRLADMNALEEAEDEMQVTGMVLEEPISNAGASDSFLNLNADKEVEEGEISGEIVGFSLVDDLSSEEKKGHFSEEIHGKEHGKSNLFSNNMTNNVVKGIEAEIREPNRNLVEYDSEIFFHAKPLKSVKLNGYRGKFNTGETKKLGSGVKKSNSPAVCLKNLVHVAGASGDYTTNILDIVSSKKDADTRNMKKRQCPPAKEKKANKKICSSQDKIELVVPGKPVEPLKAEAFVGEPSRENLSQSKENASTDEHGSASEKKRKRVVSKERRAKKRQKAKMKQALKNGKSDGKRLKLQPVLKQKSVSYCRHYLLGRCKEGALCNFSHDTTPKTKSTPCSHFARRSCMKGDNCPFDHELSKYPCNNFLTKGSCSRGVDCLFSHEMQSSEGGSSTPSKASRPDLKFMSVLDNSSSMNRLNVNGLSHEKVNVEVSHAAIPSLQSTEKNLAVTTPKPSPQSPKGFVTTPETIAQAPKGHVMTSKPAAQAPKGISFLSHGKSFKETGSSPKADDGIKVFHQMAHSASSVVQNNNENTKKPPAVAPRGINFLSFGKKLLVDVSNSSFPLKRNDGIGKSPLSNTGKGEKADSSLKKDDHDSVKVANHISQSHPKDASSDMFRVDFHPNKEAAAPALLENSKFQIPTAVPSPSPATGIPSSSQKSILPNTPISLQKVLNSTLAFASKFESEVRTGQSSGSPVARMGLSMEAGSSTNSSSRASNILDFLYGQSSKTK